MMADDASASWRAVGNYWLKTVIGRGGMGDVYRGEHRTMGRDVAIKVISPALRDEPEFLARFLREARVMARLDHENIVTIVDCGEDDGLPYLVMELLTGETLRERMRRAAGEPLELAEAVRIEAAVLDGLAAAHAQGVVHRDVKPGNIYLCADGRVKVMDFGVAKAASESHLTRTGSQIGTAEYMSPEQVEGTPVDARTDLYSAGIVFYQLLSGDVPFTGDNSLAVMHQQVHRAPPPLPPNVPAALRRTVERALAKDPGRRYQTAAEMKSALLTAAGVPAQRGGAAADEEPVRPRSAESDAARSTRTKARGLVRADRRPWRAALMGGAAFVALSAGAGLGWRAYSHHSALSSTKRAPHGLTGAEYAVLGSMDAVDQLMLGHMDEAEVTAKQAVARSGASPEAHAALAAVAIEKAAHAASSTSSSSSPAMQAAAAELAATATDAPNGLADGVRLRASVVPALANVQGVPSRYAQAKLLVVQAGYKNWTFHPYLHYAEALAYERFGYTKDAEREYEDMLQVDTHTAWVRTRLAALYAAEGRSTEALKLARAEVENHTADDDTRALIRRLTAGASGAPAHTAHSEPASTPATGSPGSVSRAATGVSMFDWVARAKPHAPAGHRTITSNSAGHTAIPRDRHAANDIVTYGSMALMVARTIGSYCSVSDQFGARAALAAMSQVGLVVGDPDGSMPTGRTVTQAAALMVLERARGLLQQRHVLSNSGPLINIDQAHELPDSHWAHGAELGLKVWHIVPNSAAIQPDAPIAPAELAEWLRNFQEVIRSQPR